MRTIKKIVFPLLFILVFAASFIYVRNHKKVRIGIVSDKNYCGEREVGKRIKLAAESLGWEAILDEKGGSKLKKIKDLDWIICLLPWNKHTYKKCPSYLTIFHPFNYIDSKKRLQTFYEKYDGFLLTINPTEALKNSIQLINKQLLPTHFYPTVQYVEYKKVPLNELMTMIAVWGNRYKNEKFKKIYRALSQSGFTRFYGIYPNDDVIDNGYMGKIPFDGESVIEVLQKHGIVLIFHSDIHNKEQIPTPRIFEAAAASTVIISDENAFVKKHFGDNVFYVDTSLSAEEIFLQIKNHMDFIRQNPQIALEMAKNAHQIFVDNFLMTDQLLNIHSMHKKLKKNK